MKNKNEARNRKKMEDCKNGLHKAKSLDEGVISYLGEEAESHERRCPSCNTPYIEYVGLIDSCKELQAWKRTAEVLWNSLLHIEGLCGTHRKNPEVFLDRIDAEIMRICKGSLDDVRKLASVKAHPDSDNLRDCSDEQLQRYLNRYINVDLPDFHFCWPDLLNLCGIAVVPQTRDGGFDWLATDLDAVHYTGDITLETKKGTEFSDPRIERAVTCCAILSVISKVKS